MTKAVLVVVHLGVIAEVRDALEGINGHQHGTDISLQEKGRSISN